MFEKKEEVFKTNSFTDFYIFADLYIFWDFIFKTELQDLKSKSNNILLSQGRNVLFAFFLFLILWLGHHHLAELVKVHRAGTVLVQLLQDALQLLLGEGGEQLGDETPQSVRADEPLALLVI